MSIFVQSGPYSIFSTVIQHCRREICRFCLATRHCKIRQLIISKRWPYTLWAYKLPIQNDASPFKQWKYDQLDCDTFNLTPLGKLNCQLPSVPAPGNELILPPLQYRLAAYTEMVFNSNLTNFPRRGHEILVRQTITHILYRLLYQSHKQHIIYRSKSLRPIYGIDVNTTDSLQI